MIASISLGLERDPRGGLLGEVPGGCHWFLSSLAFSGPSSFWAVRSHLQGLLLCCRPGSLLSPVLEKFSQLQHLALRISPAT